MELLGIRIVGLNVETAWKVLLSLGVIGLVLLVRAVLKVVPGLGDGASRRRTWIRKQIRLGFGAFATLVLLSIWFDNPNRLATFTGLIVAGAAFASQNAMLSFAAYFVIVFGKAFDLGDRIQMGEVRGDVLDIGLFKTTVMEMGTPPPLPAQGHTWITARQYTGRVVTVANSEIFKQPTYNYTRNFDFLWEEMHVPLHFEADLKTAEAILLDAARQATAGVVEEGRAAIEHMRERYAVHPGDLEPRVYIQITDNWVELTLRFLVKAFGVRELKDALSRDVLERFRAHGIKIASTTFEITALPALKLQMRDKEAPASEPPGRRAPANRS